MVPSMIPLSYLRSRFRIAARAAKVVLKPLTMVVHPFMGAVERCFSSALRATVPLVEPESYDKRWFLVAMGVSPTFVALYIRQISLWWLLGSMCAGVILSATAWLGVRGSPEPPLWTCGTSFPVGAAAVAVYGFLVAAAWVDSLATELVGLLGLLGAAMRVDHTVLGLTVLAWGNSVGDLSSNLAMARRGLSNMAITACFAGPLFNTLVGMGAGFLSYFNKGGSWHAQVHLPKAVIPGMLIALVNCTCMLLAGRVNKGRVPHQYGWVCIGLYAVYMAAAVIMTAVLRAA